MIACNVLHTGLLHHSAESVDALYLRCSVRAVTPARRPCTHLNAFPRTTPYSARPSSTSSARTCACRFRPWRRRASQRLRPPPKTQSECAPAQPGTPSTTLPAGGDAARSACLTQPKSRFFSVYRIDSERYARDLTRRARISRSEVPAGKRRPRLRRHAPRRKPKELTAASAVGLRTTFTVSNRC